MVGYNELKDMELVLVGEEKFAADIGDFFDGLRIGGLASAEGLAPKEGRLAVVCSFEPEGYAAVLEGNGLRHGEDYILGEELIKTIDETETWFAAEYGAGRKVVVWGSGPCCEELVRENPHLAVAYFVDDARAGDTLFGKEIRAVSALGEEEAGGVLVIGTPEDISEIPPMKARLREMGLRFGEDFYFYGDKHLTPDFTPGAEEERALRLAGERKLIVMGVGWYCTEILRYNPKFPVDYFIDNNADRVGPLYDGKPVRGVDALLGEEPGSFLVSVTIRQHAAEVTRQLASMGLRFGEDFYFCGKRERPSELLRRTIGAVPRSRFSCDITQRGTSVNASGGIEPCCKFVTISPIGNLCYTGLHNVFRSLPSRILQLSTVNRTFCFCMPSCQRILKADKPSSEDSVERGDPVLFQTKEYLLNLCYDGSCNLLCMSCRKTRQVHPGGNADVLAMVQEEVAAVLTPDTRLSVGYGEALYSKYYREILLEKHSARQLNLTTNGLLLDQRTWEQLGSRYQSIFVNISVDAATKETYAKVRGGAFDVLLGNLEMLGKAREAGELAALRLNMTVQRDNFREMADFVRLAISLHADGIAFLRVLNWGTWTTEEFREIDVFREDNPYHREFLEALGDPVFRDGRIRGAIRK